MLMPRDSCRYGQNRYDDRADNQPQYGAGGYGDTQPYDSRPQYDNAPPNQQYGRQPQYNMPNNGRDEYEGRHTVLSVGIECRSNLFAPDQGVELKPLVANGQEYGQSGAGQSSATNILDECKAIQGAIREILEIELPDLQVLQRAVINDPDSSANAKSSRDLEIRSSAIMKTYSILTGRVRQVKSGPDANSPRNKPHIEATDKALKRAINQFEQIDNAHSSQLKAQMTRQYKIVRPEATDAEVREAVEDPNGQQVFSQALMQGNRRGEATSVLNAVQNRHAEIQKIASQVAQLGILFEQMDVLVMQQEDAVVNIEMKGEEVVENMHQGNKEIGTAIQSAKNTRKWKWWCLGICGMFTCASFFLKTLLTYLNSCHHCRYCHYRPPLPIRVRSKRQRQPKCHSRKTCSKTMGASIRRYFCSSSRCQTMLQVSPQSPRPRNRRKL